MTLFTLILFNNVMGVMPFIQFPSMSRIAFPIVLTLVVYVVYHTVAIRRKHGVLNYLKSLVPPGAPRLAASRSCSSSSSSRTSSSGR